MKDVSELAVVQTRLFATDSIPFGKLSIVANCELIRDTFRFKNVGEASEGKAGILFNLGEFEQASKVFVVNKLIIEPRRITLDVAADSRVADLFYDSLAALLKSVGWDAPDPIVTTEETQCVVTLDFEASSLLAEPVRTYLESEAAEALRRDDAEVFITPRYFRFDVAYKVTSSRLVHHRMTIAPKPLIIEPRMDTAPEDRRYFCVSPCNSETHVRLIKALEGHIMRASKKK